MKDNSSVCFSSNLIYFGQKDSIKVKSSDFLVVGWKFTKFHISCLKTQVSFSLNFVSLFIGSSSPWEITLLHFFSSDFIWFGQVVPMKVQNFRLSIAHVKFHQICTLTDSFCWKYRKCQLKKYRRFMSNETEMRCKIWRKTNFLLKK